MSIHEALLLPQIAYGIRLNEGNVISHIERCNIIQIPFGNISKIFIYILFHLLPMKDGFYTYVLERLGFDLDDCDCQYTLK